MSNKNWSSEPATLHLIHVCQKSLWQLLKDPIIQCYYRIHFLLVPSPFPPPSRYRNLSMLWLEASIILGSEDHPVFPSSPLNPRHCQPCLSTLLVPFLLTPFSSFSVILISFGWNSLPLPIFLLPTVNQYFLTSFCFLPIPFPLTLCQMLPMFHVYIPVRLHVGLLLW